MRHRLVSLDVMRGLTVALMIQVNNPGSWEWSLSSQLRHAVWHGCTLTDLVFPFFLFAMGGAMALSLERRLRDGEAPASLLRHSLRRGGVIILIGLVLNAFPFGLPLDPTCGTRVHPAVRGGQLQPPPVAGRAAAHRRLLAAGLDHHRRLARSAPPYRGGRRSPAPLRSRHARAAARRVGWRQLRGGRQSCPLDRPPGARRRAHAERRRRRRQRSRGAAADAHGDPDHAARVRGGVVARAGAAGNAPVGRPRPGRGRSGRGRPASGAARAGQQIALDRHLRTPDRRPGLCRPGGGGLAGRRPRLASPDASLRGVRLQPHAHVLRLGRAGAPARERALGPRRRYAEDAAHAALPPCFRALGRSGMGVGPVRERPGPALDDGRLGAVPPGLGLAGVNAGRRPEPESIVLPVK
ncbi:MAG: DUF5009 domain-containing protein [bacterium]|nr:DUF5009 domain-containing protein [bacterium]